MQEEIPKTPANEIDDLLVPLMPLLKSCMDGKEIVKLAKEMTVLHYFSTGKEYYCRKLIVYLNFFKNFLEYHY